MRVELRPAPPSTGILFVRADLPGAPKIPALVAHRIEVPRRTTLTRSKASVEMVEHVLAALAALQIDNCELWVDRPEMPGLDGSSLAFVEAIDRAGIQTQNALRDQLIVRDVTRLGDDSVWIEARPATAPGLTVRYRLDYGPDNPIGRQTCQLTITPSVFREQLASCRTFMLKREADWLLEQGLGRRASLSDLLVFDDLGPIDNELRFPDECVRHKVLDLIGDLSLAGCDVVGHFIAHRSGHRLNAEMAKALLTEAEKVCGRRKSA